MVEISKIGCIISMCLGCIGIFMFTCLEVTVGSDPIICKISAGIIIIIILMIYTLAGLFALFYSICINKDDVLSEVSE